MSAAEKHNLGSVLRSYQLEILGDDPTREVVFEDGRKCPYRPIRAVSERGATELLGAEREIGFLDVILRDEMCSVRMAALTGADMASFRNRMKRVGYAPATIVRRLNLIARAIGVARLEWGINIATNPADAKQCARPKGADNKRDRVLHPAPRVRTQPSEAPEHPMVASAETQSQTCEDTPAIVERQELELSEEERLLRTCASSPAPVADPWLLAAVKLAIATAMRQGEICALEWRDVDFEQRTIAVRGPERSNGERCTKNRTIRIIPMLNDAHEVLKNLPRGTDSRVIKLGQNALKMRFRRAVADAGIQDLTFHDLRHVGTSRLAKIYKDPLTLRLVTGHKDIKSLARYFHKSPQELLEEAHPELWAIGGSRHNGPANSTAT